MAADTLNFKKVAKVVGIKQSLKAVEKGNALTVYSAANADQRMISPLQQACQTRNLPIITDFTLAELGAACGIDVEAAAVAILK